MMDKKDITIFILAGGQSSRMGTDKALLEWEGKPFLQRIVEQSKLIIPSVVIVSNSPEHDRFNCPRITDSIENTGPLVGIQSALAFSNTQWNLILSCDAPKVTFRFLNWLLQVHKLENAVTVPLLNDKMMPLMAIYSKAVLPEIEMYLKEGKRSVKGLLAYLETRYVQLPIELWPELLNINTPKDFDRLKTIKSS